MLLLISKIAKWLDKYAAKTGRHESYLGGL
jgi:hypothetical protein